MLVNDLRERIKTHGPMTVRDFMHAALHDPLGGYYAKGRDIGSKGDFYTSANVSLFPQPVKRFLEQAKARLGDDVRFVELGAGTGGLAKALGLDIIVVEPNPGMAERQRANGLTVVPSLAKLESAPTVFFGNEVLDALAVHRILPTSDGPREGYVELEGDRFVERPGPFSTPVVEAAAARYAPWLDEGGAVEVNLEAKQLLADMARVAPSAVAAFVDYGGGPAELFGESRPRGSLRAYLDHKPAEWLDAPGTRDITADVDFEFIQQEAKDTGWAVGGYRTQGEWLANLGLVDDMSAALRDGDVNAYLAAKNLIFPGGMGERFKVLGLSRGLKPDTPLPGFAQGPI